MNRDTVVEYIKSLSESEVQDLLREVQGARVDALQDKVTDLSTRMAQLIEPQKFETSVDLTVHISGSLLLEDGSDKVVTDTLEVKVKRREGSQVTISDDLLETVETALVDAIDHNINQEEDTEIAELETLYSQISEASAALREEINTLEDEADEDLLQETDLAGDIYESIWDRIAHHALNYHSAPSTGIAASPRR